MSDTPETDATANPLWGDAQELCLLRELARKLERERDEAVLQLGAMQAAIAEVLNLPRTPTTADEIRGAAQHLTTPAQ